ncbi:mitochondrial inner membrane protease subunit 2 [Pogonomyrmex barbatus]|uniref:Mitochondrial inner membrane protease subunit 2 n=1 Tax=Pogonomyrmex barbatus TaxID=144034 RepID=A0A6I9WER3_9HYME|nr:mitochondrial inner membrane protease subunit 2 [Pogonomyrmex barbatus]
MQPALNPDLRYPDYVFLNRWAIRNHKIQRGDIVCVVSPKVPNQTLIKRVIGLAGDIIGTHGYKISALQVWISCIEVISNLDVYQKVIAGWKEITLGILWILIPLGQYLWVW